MPPEVTAMADANRTKALLVRLTNKEHDALKDQSARTGRCMSDILRAAWKKLKIVELPPAERGKRTQEHLLRFRLLRGLREKVVVSHQHHQ